MAITTVVPNATASGSNLYTITGGSGSVNAALSDGADGTYVQKTSSVVGIADAILDFGTFTLTSSQTVKQVRLRARCSTPTSTSKLAVYLGSRISNQNYFFSGLAISGQFTSATTFTGAYYNSAPDGSSWSQTSINNLRAKISEYKETTDRGKFYELYIDVDVATQPTVTVVSPSGAVSGTTTPDVAWTFADSVDNGTQAYYQIKAFTSAQYGISGFDVNTSPSTYDSGQVNSSDQASTISSLLVAGNYRVYIRVAKDINGAPFWSDWASSNFSISYTAPTIPAMAVAWSSTLGYATFNLVGAATSYTSQFFQVERSDDSGTTYSTIDLGSAITVSGTPPSAITYDYEAPRGIVVYYRARAVGVDANGNQFASGYCAVQQVLITNDSTWWLKVPSSPSLNRGSIRVQQQIDTTLEEPTTVFRPLGSTRPIVVAGPLQGEDGTYNIVTITEAEWDSLFPILQYQGTILVQDPFANQKYIRIIDRTWTAETTGGNIRRDIKVKYVEVLGHY